MKIQLLSDVHTEFHADFGESFIESTLSPIDDVDVLVLAGDIGNVNSIEGALSLFADVWWPRPVVYVVGNHEFYGGTFKQAKAAIQRACSECKNLLWLNHDYDWITPDKPFSEDTWRFVGTPLWFRDVPETHLWKDCIGDFNSIKDGGKWIYDENKRALEFLDKTLRKDDILITHHLPSSVCVAPEYVGSFLNVYFVCEIGELIAERQPKLALFGHTHSSIDTMIGSTRVVCNPFGYAGVELNPDFKDKLIIEV